MKTPNFFYIGPDKAGSTWIFRALRSHPDIFVTSAKDLYYFDQYYERGLDWYTDYFKRAENEVIVADISHDYLYSIEAMSRIKHTLPNARFMVCLREPVDRAFSAYLNLKRVGLIHCDFETAVKEKPELISNGFYGKHLEPWLEAFGKERIYIGIFDSLQENSELFANHLFSFLGVDTYKLPPEVHGKALAAAKARVPLITFSAKRVAMIARKLGFAEIVGKIKGNDAIYKTLFKTYGGDKPTPDKVLVERLKSLFRDDIYLLDKLVDGDFAKRWNYD